MKVNNRCRSRCFQHPTAVRKKDLHTMTSDSTTLVKTCTKCGQTLPATLEYFYKKKRGLYGLYARCKECHVEQTTPHAKAWNKSNPEKMNETARRWQKSNPDYMRAQSKKYRSRNPEKMAARSAVHYAARIGALPQISDCVCTKCGSQAEDYHHWSYEGHHQLDVIPMCKTCHIKIHRMNKDDRAKLEARLIARIV